MPTLVAASVAPTNTWTSTGWSGRSQPEAAAPSAMGTATPMTATSTAEGPTRASDLRSVSRPNPAAMSLGGRVVTR